jgi:hypothetical protein
MRSFSCLAPALAVLLSASLPAAKIHFAAQPVQAKGAAAGLVGTWESPVRKPPSLGMTVLFSPDSVISIVVGPMVDGTYTLEGSQLTLVDIVDRKPTSETMTVSFQRDTVVFSAGARSRRLTRLDTVTADTGVLGRWWYIDREGAGVPAYQEFTADGVTRLRIPVGVMKGMYSVRGNKMKLRMLSPHQENKDASFIVKGDTLTLRIPGASGSGVFLRARPLIPYSVQQPAPPPR